MDEDEITSINLRCLGDFAPELGYKSLFQAIAEAQFSTKERQGFRESGGLEELLYGFHPPKKRCISVDIDNNRFANDICGLSHEVYSREWQRLLG